MLLILYLGKRRYPKASKLALLLPVWGIINLVYGAGWNAEYVYKHGVRGEGVIIRVEPTNSWINEVQVFNYHCLIKTKSGKTIETYFENSGDAFYPATDLWMPPQIGEPFSIKYVDGDEDNFIILTNDQASAYSNKINCTQLLQEITSAQAAYNFDKKNAANKRAFKQLIEKFLKEPCDTNLQRAYRMQLEELR